MTSVSETRVRGFEEICCYAVFSAPQFALRNRCRNRGSPKREHWMDWAEDRYEVRQQRAYLPVHTLVHVYIHQATLYIHLCIYTFASTFQYVLHL